MYLKWSGSRILNQNHPPIYAYETYASYRRGIQKYTLNAHCNCLIVDSNCLGSTTLRHTNSYAHSKRIIFMTYFLYIFMRSIMTEQNGCTTFVLYHDCMNMLFFHKCDPFFSCVPFISIIRTENFESSTTL